MANEEQLAILKSGVNEWNQWRARNIMLQIDLSLANLSHVKLGYIDFSNSDLRGVNLNGADLCHANLQNSNLSDAKAIAANFLQANLQESILNQANLSHANLSFANLCKAELQYTILSSSVLQSANLRGTILANVDLRYAVLNSAVLTYLSLQNVDLLGASLESAELVHVDLSDARLMAANLRGARINNVDFKDANLRLVDLRQAIFFACNLREADLCGANLRHAHFYYVDLTRTKLTCANFSESEIVGLIFSDVDLSEVEGLDTVIHGQSSSIDLGTIYASRGEIPKEFLRGAGVDDTFITFMKSLTNSVIEYYSCFISHASKDKEFAERLYADLQSNGVRCWYAPHHMEIGAPILNEIDKAIRVHDKLLLILSENSVGSRWVEHEVLSATTKEFQQERDTRTLFPIRLDDAVMDTNVQWARNLKETRHIADFTYWKDHDRYKVAFDRLLRDLKGKS